MADTFAIIKTGGKQYRVSEGDTIIIEKLKQEDGAEFDFEQVLMIGNGSADTAKIGQPLVPGAKVHAKVVEHGRDKKKISMHFKNKTRQKTKKGHRQPHTKVQILKITV